MNIPASIHRTVLNKTRSKIKNVVYSAGGLKGFAYIGAMYEFCNHSEKTWKEFCNSLDSVAGTSIGSLAAVSTVLAVPLNELVTYVLGYDLSDLVNKPTTRTLVSRAFSWMSNITAPSFGNNEMKKRETAISQEYYISDGTNLATFFRAFLEKFAGDPDITLAELYAITGRSVHLFGCSYYKRKSVDFCHETFPHLPVWMAMRASSSLPVVFKPMSIAGDVYIDGGMMVYTPHHNFPSEETLVFQINIPPYHATTFGEYCFQVWDCLFAGQQETLMLRNPDLRRHLVDITCTSFTMKDLLSNNISKELIFCCIREGQNGVQSYVTRIVVVLLLVHILYQMKIQNTEYKNLKI